MEEFQAFQEPTKCRAMIHEAIEEMETKMSTNKNGVQLEQSSFLLDIAHIPPLESEKSNAAGAATPIMATKTFCTELQRKVPIAHTVFSFRPL